MQISPKAKPIKFRKWIICEDLKNQIIESAGDKQFAEKTIAYLSAFFDLEEKKLKSESWERCVELFYHAVTQTPKLDVPIIKDAPRGGKDADWNYPGRNLNYYCHLLADAYGWNLEYIYDLDPSQAMALVQEILTAKQLDDEFLYSLSEVAYPYNRSTKKSEYKPMKRPYWMKPAVAPVPKKMKMRRDMLPTGRIIDMSGLPPEMQIEGLVTEKPEKK